MTASIEPLLPAGADWAFVALQYHTLILNRVYVVCVNANKVVGLAGNGVIAAPPRVTPEMYEPWFWVNLAKFQRYTHLHIDSGEILREAKPNFAIPFEDITVVEFSDDSKWGMGTVPYSGRIIITANGKRREFILLGRQDGKGIRKSLVGAREF